jgi:sulfur carrier protein ThiS
VNGCFAFRKGCRQVAVKVILRQEEVEVPGPVSVGEALHRLNLPPESYLVIRDGVLLDETEILQDGDTIRLVGVISGG